MKRIINPKLKDKNFLYQEFMINNKNPIQIAKEMDVASSTVYAWLTRFGILQQRQAEEELEKQKLINQKFGKITLIKYIETPKNIKDNLARYRDWVECKCDCGKIIITHLSNLKNGNKKSCGCSKHLSGEKAQCFQGYKEISGKFFTHIKRTAQGGTTKRKRICKDFTITIEYLWELYLKQNRKCALTGVELYFNSRSGKTDGNISLDRIDSLKGYIEGNVQWVHKDANIMKNKLPQDRFIYLCGLIWKKFNNQ